MKYQLVLQFQGDDDDTLEKVIELEDQLIEAFDGSTTSEVDGHEVGSRDVQPDGSHQERRQGLGDVSKAVVEDAVSGGLELNAVAFRPLDGEEYTVLWPADYEGEFEVV